MERISELTDRTLAVIFESYTLWLSLFILVLVFVVYLYIFPNVAFEGFRNRTSAKQENTRKHQ